MTDETEMQSAMQQQAPKWESKVVCISAVSPWALAKKVNDVYSDGRWVVGTQVFRDEKQNESWVALVYYKVRTQAGERAVYATRPRQYS